VLGETFAFAQSVKRMTSEPQETSEVPDIFTIDNIRKGSSLADYHNWLKEQRKRDKELSFKWKVKIDNFIYRRKKKVCSLHEQEIK
jgi:hypothetical protein